MDMARRGLGGTPGPAAEDLEDEVEVEERSGLGGIGGGRGSLEEEAEGSVLSFPWVTRAATSKAEKAEREQDLELVST